MPNDIQVLIWTGPPSTVVCVLGGGPWGDFVLAVATVRMGGALTIAFDFAQWLTKSIVHVP